MYTYTVASPRLLPMPTLLSSLSPCSHYALPRPFSYVLSVPSPSPPSPISFARASTGLSFFLDLGCCWSSLVARRPARRARLCLSVRLPTTAWLLARTEPSHSCTFIVPPPS